MDATIISIKLCTQLGRFEVTTFKKLERNLFQIEGLRCHPWPSDLGRGEKGYDALH